MHSIVLWRRLIAHRFSYVCSRHKTPGISIKHISYRRSQCVIDIHLSTILFKVYIHEKREVRLFLTLIKGFAIPHTVEKQPKSTPDMLNPPTHLTGGDWYYIPTRTFIVAVRTVCECCEDSDESQTTSINAFLCYCLSFAKERHYKDTKIF